jgi:hypothetical protein
MAEIRDWQSDELERSPGRVHCIRHLPENWYERDVAKYPPVREKTAMLLDVSNFPAQQDGRLSPDILVADSYFSAQRLHQSVETAEQRRFARSTFSDERNGASGWHVDAHIVQRYDGSEAVGHISGSEGRRHALKTDYTRDLALCLPRASTITR